MIFALLIAAGIGLLLLATFVDIGLDFADELLLGLAVTLAIGGAAGGIAWVATEASWSLLAYTLLVVGVGVAVAVLTVPPLLRFARREAIAQPLTSAELLWARCQVMWWSNGHGSVSLIARDNHVTLPATGPTHLTTGQIVHIVSADDSRDGATNVTVDIFDQQGTP